MSEIRQIIIDMDGDKVDDITVYFTDSAEPWSVWEFEEESLTRKELEILARVISMAAINSAINKRK